jgi:hypothetical protein
VLASVTAPTSELITASFGDFLSVSPTTRQI